MQAKRSSETTVVYVRVDRSAGVEEGGAWWQVATAEVAETEAVRDAHESDAPKKRRQRWHIGP
jgi:3D-(3,5/4)-trihydroxycyclohexane-1,2-dione acylhydrolase (decyclizing)